MDESKNEIKSCEQYVLKELAEAQEENKQLNQQVQVMRGIINFIKEYSTIESPELAGPGSENVGNFRCGISFDLANPEDQRMFEIFSQLFDRGNKK